MARMIPPYCVETAPPGERAVFTAFEKDKASDGWLVFHSLGIAEHERQVEGEADFVVVAPQLGILVIEVKSHLSVERTNDGRWKLGNDALTARGPFQQCHEAMHSIRNYLQKKKIDLWRVPVLSAVWFTGVRAKATLASSPEWHEWEILDLLDLASAGNAIRRVFTRGSAHLSAKGLGPFGLEPTSEAAARIGSALRPRFEVVSTPGDRRRTREGQLAQFVDEQYRALDSSADNRAVLFIGAAGTGKTFLAAESAQREIAQGRSGRLLCFNRLLAAHLQSKLADVPNLRVGTFHQELLRLAGLDAPPVGASDDFWEQELPDRALEGLAKSEASEVGDFLIVDEIQDLSASRHLDLLDLLVAGGLESGRVLLFGDFERQSIYEAGSALQLVRERVHGIATYRLLENCRNLPRIGYEVNALSRLKPGFQSFRRSDDGVDPDLLPYRRGEDQSPLIASSIRQLRDEGYDLSEIVVLSPRRAGSALDTSTDQWLRQVLRPATGHRPTRGHGWYSTIHSFKGLDSPAVIVTDLDAEGVPNFESLLYVGLTRATDRLVVIVESETLRNLIGAKA